MEKHWEYIVVGSGAGGGPVAANLARAGHKVLLLEAGGSPHNPYADVPAFHPMASEQDDMSWKFFVRHYTDPAQQERDSKYVPQEEGIFYPRAGTLGGCTVHNAMILGYPSNSDWDCIAELMGDESWSGENMRRYFVSLERCRYRTIQRILQTIFRWNPSRHGFKGWLSSDEADPELLVEDEELLEIVLDSVGKAFKSAGHPLQRALLGVLTLFDPNDWRSVKKNSEGTRQIPITVRRGRRFSTRELLLETWKKYPHNLTIRLGALATRVLFDDDQRAIGVEYLEGEHLYRADPLRKADDPGVLRQVGASREVILAGGAFNTPQLLQLSGVGPPDLLAEHGIPLRVDLPGVGRNLQDRYEVGVVLRMKKPFKLLEGSTMRPPAPGEEPDPQYKEWLQGKGVYTTNGAVVSLVIRSAPSRPVPDLYIFGLVSDFRGYYPGYSLVCQEARQYFTWAILKAHTNNTAGLVAIRSRDPRDVPYVNFHYFNEGNDTSGEDLESVVTGVEFVRSITEGYRDLIEKEEVPGDAVQTRDQIRELVRNEAWGHHASCTCQIGPRHDPYAVLDSNFRVYGTHNLRVVDASAFPRIPGMFVVSAIYMIAEKASEAILADAKA